MRPSGKISRHADPAFQSLSKRMSNQYFRMNSVVVSAVHSSSGVVRM